MNTRSRICRIGACQFFSEVFEYFSEKPGILFNSDISEGTAEAMPLN